MARPRSPNRDKAFHLWVDSGKKRKLKDIAEELGISEEQVRKWKNQDKWDKVTLPKTKSNITNHKSELLEKEKAIADEVGQVISNPELTDKQRLFCLYYIRCFNATKAYQKAYGCSYETAVTNGPGLLGNTRVRDEIQRLKQNRLNRELLSEDDIFQKYMDIAFADMNDFAEISDGMVHVKADLDGTLLSELSDTANGVKVKLADRMKALQWLSDHMDLATAEQSAKIQAWRAQTAVMEEKKAREGSKEETVFQNMETLADVLKHSQPNRNIKDYEEEQK